MQKAEQRPREQVSSERIILYLLAFAQFIHIVDFMILMPLGDVLMTDFSINPMQFSGLVASYSLSAGVSGFLAATFLDRFDRRKALLTTMVFFAVGTFFCSVSVNYEWLLFSRIWTGTFGGLIGGIVIAILSDLIPFERRGAAMGIISMAFAFASVIGVPLSLLIADYLGWQAPFRFIFLISLPAIYGFWKYLPPMVGHLRAQQSFRPLEELKSLVADVNSRRALMLAYFMVLGHFLVIPFITPYLTRNIGVLQTDIKFIYLIGGGATLITAPLIGKWSDRVGHFKMYAVVLILSLIPIVLVTHVQHASMLGVYLITVMFFMFASGRMIPAQTMMTAAIAAKNRGGFMSLRSALLEFGGGTASLVGGWLITESADGKIMNYPYVGYLSVAIGLSTIFIAKGIVVKDQ
jgi:MFS transporter, DHA1 family, inner membrane transport protein